MKLARSTDAPAAHVLHWVPGWLCSNGQGTWELQDTSAYEAGKAGFGCPQLYAARNAGPEVLAEWLAGQLGYPVALVLDWATLSSAAFRPLSLNISREPVYYIRPAA